MLLNRDDAGLAKRLPYGGTVRTRISSQSLKRHWRCADDAWALKGIGAPMGVRSREIVERRILPTLSGAPEIVEAVRAALVKHLYGKNSAKISDRQALLLGQPEIDYLARIGAEAVSAAKDAKSAEAEIDARIAKGTGKANLAAMLATAGTLAAGLEAALFGRMVTSDPDANTDAAIHVAHAFTVHAQEPGSIAPDRASPTSRRRNSTRTTVGGRRVDGRKAARAEPAAMSGRTCAAATTIATSPAPSPCGWRRRRRRRRSTTWPVRWCAPHDRSSSDASPACRPGRFSSRTPRAGSSRRAISSLRWRSCRRTVVRVPCASCFPPPSRMRRAITSAR